MRVPICAVLALLLAACGDDPHWGALAAERVRELPLLRDVEVVTMSREEFAARAAERADQIDDAYLQYVADTYGRLGFFDMDLDLRPVFAGSSSDWVGATYSPSSKRITLVGEAAPSTVVHEFVHALQDQHFVLADYDRPATSDSFLARRAVVEGDATLAQYRFMANEEGFELDGIDWAALFGRWRQFSRDILLDNDYPAIFLDYVSFTYPFGLEYGAANLIGATMWEPLAAPSPHDWGLQDQLYRVRGPVTTSQILDLDLAPSEPAFDDIGLEAVPASLTDRLTTVDWDRLGEWYVYLLFFPMDVAGQVEARALASGWRGDRALFVQDAATGAAGTAWASSWDDAGAATAVADALRQLYGLTPVEGEVAELHAAADGELVWLEQREHRLVVTKNVAPEVAPALAEAAFAPVSTRRLRTHRSPAETLERLRRHQRGCGHLPALPNRPGSL